MAKILFSKAIETMRDSSTSGLVLQYQNGSTEKDTEWGIPAKLKRAYQDYHTRYAHKISTPDRTKTLKTKENNRNKRHWFSSSYKVHLFACLLLIAYFLLFSTLLVHLGVLFSGIFL